MNFQPPDLCAPIIVLKKTFEIPTEEGLGFAEALSRIVRYRKASLLLPCAPLDRVWQPCRRAIQKFGVGHHRSRTRAKRKDPCTITCVPFGSVLVYSASLPNVTTRCQSVRLCHSPLSFFQDSFVATEIGVTGVPFDV